MTELDVFAVAAVLVDRIRRDYPDDVALVAYYGSYARGTAAAHSDLDLFFVPASVRGREAAVTVLVAGVTFDFWGIDWDWLERSARLAERGAPIIAEAKILYARSEADRRRLEELRRALADLPISGEPLVYAELADDRLQPSYPALHATRRALAAASSSQSDPALADARRLAVEVVLAVCAAVATLNRTFLRSSGPGQIEELRTLPLVPAGLVDDLRQVIGTEAGADVVRAGERAVDATQALICSERRRLGAPVDLPGSAVGFFEELAGLLAKLRGACRAGDQDAALFVAVTIEHEVAELLGADVRPDLVSWARAATLERLLHATDELEADLRRRLALAGVPLLEYSSLAELRTSFAPE